MLKKFCLASASVLMLAIAYHLGASTATAQAPGNPVVGISAGNWVVTANGDIYVADGGNYQGPWSLRSNVFRAISTPAQAQSWGALKAKSLSH